MIYGYEHAFQFSVFFKSVGCGYAVGVLYVLSEIIKFAGKKYFLLNIFRDISFFVISAILSFMFFLKFNSGIFRFYLLFGEAIGFCIFMIYPGLMLIDKINIFHRKLFVFIGVLEKCAASVLSKILNAAKNRLQLIKHRNKSKNK